MQYRFVALVFPEHAVFTDYEMWQSRISKPCLKRSEDDEIVFSWDRGLDGIAAEPDAQRAVEILGRVLAKLVYHRQIP
jgi:hypothetical protein